MTIIRRILKLYGVLLQQQHVSQPAWGFLFRVLAGLSALLLLALRLFLNQLRVNYVNYVCSDEKVPGFFFDYAARLLTGLINIVTLHF